MMKTRLFIILFLFTLVLISCDKKQKPTNKENHLPNDKETIHEMTSLNRYFITSDNGIYIRDKPSLSGEKIGFLKYLDPVYVLKVMPKNEDVIYDKDEIIGGNWVLIKNDSVKEKESYVFNGFLKKRNELKSFPSKGLDGYKMLINGKLGFECKINEFIKTLGKPDSILSYRTHKDYYHKLSRSDKDGVLQIIRYISEDFDAESWHFDDVNARTFYKNGIEYEELNGQMFFTSINLKSNPKYSIKYKNHIWNSKTTIEDLFLLFPNPNASCGGHCIELPFKEGHETSWVMGFDDNDNFSSLQFYYYD